MTILLEWAWPQIDKASFLQFIVKQNKEWNQSHKKTVSFLWTICFLCLFLRRHKTQMNQTDTWTMQPSGNIMLFYFGKLFYFKRYLYFSVTITKCFMHGLSPLCFGFNVFVCFVFLSNQNNTPRKMAARKISHSTL